MSLFSSYSIETSMKSKNASFIFPVSFTLFKMYKKCRYISSYFPGHEHSKFHYLESSAKACIEEGSDHSALKMTPKRQRHPLNNVHPCRNLITYLKYV